MRRLADEDPIVVQSRLEKNAEAFIVKARLTHGGKFGYDSVAYVNSQTKVSIECPAHGIFQQAPAEHVRGFGCAECAGNVRFEGSSVVEELKQYLSDYDYTYENAEYVSTHVPMLVTCPEHGDFKIFRHDVKYDTGKHCPSCRKESRLKKKQKVRSRSFIRRLKEYLGHENYDFSKTVYTKAHIPVTITCKEHGDFQKPAYVSFSGCPSCGKRCSTQQRKLITEFQHLNPLVNDKTLLGGRELDLYFPEQKLGIEVDGVYWHTEQYRNTPTTHLRKTLECRDAGVQLLRITDQEIDSSLDIVKSMVASKLGLSDRVWARKTRVVVLPNVVANAFCDKYHIQGSVGHKLALGLVMDKKLLMVMTFGKPRFSKGYDWELLRMCSVFNTVVVGGASKLLTHFERTYKPQSLLSYANLRFSFGRVYKRLGFTLHHRSKPSFVWVKGGSIVSRYMTQKRNINSVLTNYDPDMSQVENMHSAGFYRMWDCGTLVFEKLYR